MKRLLDQNLSFKFCGQLADLFPGSSQARLLGLADANDRAVWDYAGRNGFALVTQDSDFADLAGLLGPPPKVIWLRAGNQRTGRIEQTLRDHADVILEFAENRRAACLEIY